jgi:hypothetical protein
VIAEGGDEREDGDKYEDGVEAGEDEDECTGTPLALYTLLAPFLAFRPSESTPAFPTLPLLELIF